MKGCPATAQTVNPNSHLKQWLCNLNDNDLGRMIFFGKRALEQAIDEYHSRCHRYVPTLSTVGRDVACLIRNRLSCELKHIVAGVISKLHDADRRVR